MTDEADANTIKDQPVTIAAPPVAAVTIDPQNPLPEPSFVIRRIFAAAIAANTLVFVWFVAAWLVGGEQWQLLYGLTKLLMCGCALILTYYFVAPSAAELTQLVQSASIIKHSLSMAAGATESRVVGRFGASTAPEGQIPVSTPDEAPRGLSGDLSVESTPEDIPQSVGASDPSSK